MGRVKHPLIEENKRIGEISKHRHKRHRVVRNPLRGSLLERRIQRAIYCVEKGSRDMCNWFEAETGMTPQAYIDKWEKKLL